MSERGMLFSAPMVRALLDGRKTMTRRLMPTLARGNWEIHDDEWVVFDGDQIVIRKPARFLIGDRLWVREAWRIEGCGNRVNAEACRRFRGHGREIEYRADGYAPEMFMERSPIHMPRWASRLTLTVTDVKVERLQDISRADAIAEGLSLASANIEEFFRWPAPHAEHLWLSPRAAYEWLWNNLHGPDAWAANPWVVAVSFTVALRNIDAEPAP